MTRSALPTPEGGARSAYRLTARLGRLWREEIVWADDDDDASFAAMAIVLNRAYREVPNLMPERRVWARGAIRLARPDGTVVQEMSAK